MSPIVGDLLLPIIEGKNPRRIFLASDHRPQSSPMSATYTEVGLESLSVVIQGEH